MHRIAQKFVFNTAHCGFHLAAGLDTVLGVVPICFRYNGLGGTVDDGKIYVGVIAQDLPAELSPYCRHRTLVRLRLGSRIWVWAESVFRHPKRIMSSLFLLVNTDTVHTQIPYLFHENQRPPF